MGGGGAPESELFAQELVAFDGCRGRESYFSLGMWLLLTSCLCLWIAPHHFHMVSNNWMLLILITMKKENILARGLTQKSGGLASVQEDLNSIPSTYRVAHNHL